MKVQCLLVDDEPLAIQLLQKHIGQIDAFEVAGTAQHAMQALELLHTTRVDLLFLDIKMPKISGLDLLKTLKNPPAVILTTAYREYALDGYDLDIADYLLKPITFDRFFRAADRYLRRYKKPGVSVALAAGPEPVWIQIKSAHKYHKVYLDDILLIESRKEYIRVVTQHQELMSRQKISDWEQTFSGQQFLRIHRSFIINRNNVTAFTTMQVELGAHQVPIGDTYKVYALRVLGAG